MRQLTPVEAGACYNEIRLYRGHSGRSLMMTFITTLEAVKCPCGKLSAIKSSLK